MIEDLVVLGGYVENEDPGLENHVASFSPLVSTSRYKQFRAVSKWYWEGSSFSTFGERGGGGESYAENEDPGQIFLIIENRVVSYSPLVSRSRCE